MIERIPYRWLRAIYFWALAPILFFLLSVLTVLSFAYFVVAVLHDYFPREWRELWRFHIRPTYLIVWGKRKHI
ncbi:hypothetical protein [Phyllobacterium endophyticum]|uniref:hypothetical protein n=1 Tax=Phyllobacterium endophyticum TaxID=1149773 RepID=UPI0011C8055C|nr:hypothetical protein [Phyllobacterium endophyticum]TXR49912.1 hypothetical protein FVA77_07820 [Phyllobacterium endophyticum]